MRPPIPYYGSKGTLGPAIASMLPMHAHYIEPFAGSLAVLLAKPMSPVETVNDLDGHLMTFWRMLRDRPDDLARACALTPHSRAEFMLSRDTEALDTVDDLEVARRVWVSLTQGRSAVRSKTGWRYSKSEKTQLVNEGPRFVERMEAVSWRIRRVQLENMDALELIKLYGDHPDNLFYVDPPYLADTRNTSLAGGYLHEMPDEASHRALRDVLADIKGTFVLSGYRSPLYDELYEGCDVAEIPHQTTNGGAGKATCEVLWSNRPLLTTPALF